MVALVEETDVLEPELAVPPDEEEEEEEEEEAPPSRVGVSTPSPFTTPPPERPYTELDRNVVSVCFITFHKCSG